MREVTNRAASDDDLLTIWRERFETPVTGWDFTELSREMSEEASPWSYHSEARQRLLNSSHVLDMGTGGGEVLLTLADALPDDTVATEGWPPNVPIATAALAPHGVEVLFYDAEAVAS